MKPNIKLLEDTSPLEQLSLQSTSYSRLSSFDWCQAQFFYSYILKLPQEYGPKAILGNIIHKALELTVRHGEKVDRAELFDNYRAAREDYDPEESIISDELYADGIEMLEGYLARQGTSKAQVTEAELAFEFVFHGTLLRGYIDQVLVKDDEVIVVDFKSGAWEVSDKKVPMDLQLGIYALYMKFLYPDKKITANLYYLKSNKIKGHTFSDEDFLDIETRLRKTIDRVRDHNNFLPVAGYEAWKCRMCSYMKDGTCKAGQFNVDKADKKKNKLIGNYSEFS